MEQDGGLSATIEMIPDGDGGSTTTAPAARMITRKEKREQLVPQLRFAPGYHFVPDDFELLNVYLRGKIEGREPPLDIFMDVDFLDWEPDKLIAEREAYGEDRYFFFTVREKSPTNKDSQPRRKLRTGGVAASWKATGSVKNILRPGTNEVVGTKRMLTYSSGRCKEEDKYSMKEYVLEDFSKMDQWVLCTIQVKQRWKANEAKNASSGKDKIASSGEDKKRKRGTDTCVKPKTTKGNRQKKTPTSQLQETQQQEQQEVTPAIFPDPTPLLAHEQLDHHQAWEEEDAMAFEETSSMIQVAAPHEYPDGYLNASTQQETMAWDGPGEPPLMTHHQQGHQASMGGQQFDTLGAEYMPEHQLSAMAQFPTQYLKFQFYQQQQQQHCTYELFSPFGGMRYQFLQQQVHNGLGTQGFHGDITGTLQDAPQFLQESGKPQQTSPNSVLGGPDPGPPSQNAYPYSDSDAGMMNGVASTVVPQATSYGSAADHQFNPVGFLGHGFDDNLAGNWGGSDASMGLPDQGSNHGLHVCQHGVQWRCGGEQHSVDMESCFRCLTSCAQYHSN